MSGALLGVLVPVFVRDERDENNTLSMFFSTDFESEYNLTTEFCQAHYLVGVLLIEVRAAFSEVNKVRQMAIRVLCNVLAKHAFDDRYQGSVSSRSSSLI